MKKALYPLLIVAVMISAALSLMLGSANIPPSQLFSAICGEKGYETQRVILLSIRLPRFFASALSGIGLSVAGLLLQNFSQNRLASPNTVGLNAGAGFAVVLVLSLFPQLSPILPFFSFLGALLAMIPVLTVGRFSASKSSSMLLAGVAFSALFNGAISFICSLDSDVLSDYNAFGVGGFSSILPQELYLPAILILLCFTVALFLAPGLALLALGKDQARSLGVNSSLMSTLTLLLASLLTASVISFAGLLGFVGLIVPNLVSYLAPQASFRERMVLCALVSTVLVSLSDLLGRCLFSPGEISVGIIMAFIGAPFFLALIIKRKSYND
ncbi:MAG: iron ABC transporter permease [Ruminococcaceae bacterium]|nr:iron ABC transporter permease [Oscillospiraceae bacterium]